VNVSCNLGYNLYQRQRISIKAVRVFGVVSQGVANSPGLLRIVLGGFGDSAALVMMYCREDDGMSLEFRRD